MIRERETEREIWNVTHAKRVLNVFPSSSLKTKIIIANKLKRTFILRKGRNSKIVRSLPFFDEKYLKVRKRIVADDRLKRIFIGENSKSVHSIKSYPAIRK